MAIIKKGEAEVIFKMKEWNLSVGTEEIHLLTADVSKVNQCHRSDFPL